MTTNTQVVYGITMPVRVYDIHWQCGCITKDVECASEAPIANPYLMPQKCPRCYTGPYFNVWD